jgi:hypothetical protein
MRLMLFGFNGTFQGIPDEPAGILHETAAKRLVCFSLNVF